MKVQQIHYIISHKWEWYLLFHFFLYKHWLKIMNMHEIQVDWEPELICKKQTLWQQNQHSDDNIHEHIEDRQSIKLVLFISI